MNKIGTLFVSLYVLTAVFAQNACPVIPKPASLVPVEGKQRIKKGMVISFTDSSLLPVVHLLQEHLGMGSLQVKWVPTGKRSSAAIHFFINKDLQAEAYRLQIGAKQTQISSLLSPNYPNLPPRKLSTLKDWRQMCRQNILVHLVS